MTALPIFRFAEFGLVGATVNARRQIAFFCGLEFNFTVLDFLSLIERSDVINLKNNAIKYIEWI